MGLAEELSKIGYGRSERLTPAGFPALPNQPVYRYQSNSTQSSTSVLFQSGLGQFSVHGVPPYKSWEVFLPTVRNGLEALLRVYPQTVGDKPISVVNLRYIDFFDDDLTQGRDVATFMAEVLGIPVQLPNFVTAIATSKRIENLLLKFSLPIAAGTLNLSVGEAKFNNRPGVLLDTSVSTSGAITPNIDRILEVLNASYSALHTIFIDLTKPIEQAMQPKGTVIA